MRDTELYGGDGNNRDMEGDGEEECTRRYDAFIQMTVVHTSVKGIKTMGNYLQLKDHMWLHYDVAFNVGFHMEMQWNPPLQPQTQEVSGWWMWWIIKAPDSEKEQNKLRCSWQTSV